MKKLVSLALVFFIFTSNYSIFAYGESALSKNFGKFFRVIKAMAATGIVLGAFAGVKVAATEAKKLESKKKEYAVKTAIGVSGVCASAASLIFAINNLNDLYDSGIKGDKGVVNEFCLLLNLANIVASLYTLKYIVSGQVFSGNSLKISIGL